MLRDDELAAKIEEDYEAAGLDPRRLAILRYADKLTRTPAEVRADDLAPMREAGLTDTDILHVAEVTAYYGYVNRIADGLGVPLEPWIPEDAR